MTITFDLKIPAEVERMALVISAFQTHHVRFSLTTEGTQCIIKVGGGV
jgi:hypothetical protein